MYADSLITPHPGRPSAEEVPQILSAVIRHQGFGEQLDVFDDREEYEENALAAAHIICSQVREALWYPESKKDFEALGLEEPVELADLPEAQAGDCFAFTIVASECLEMTGIDHWIGFANGHATILLPTEGGRRLHLTDPLSPVLSQDLQHSMVRGGSRDHSVVDDMEEFGRSAIELNTLSLALRARGDTAELLGEHTWLTFRRGGDQNVAVGLERAQAIMTGRDPYGRELHPSRSRVFMSVFLPEDGRQMLHDYDDFQHAYRRGEYLDAAGILYDRLGNAYPDLDARQSHVRVKTVVRELAGNGAANYARKLLDEYFESFAIMADDSRVPEAHADCLSIVAREAGDSAAAGEAAEIYRQVLDYRKSYREAVEGKLSKATALVARLHLGPLPNA